MKHTPGPWTIRKEKRTVLICDEYGNHIAAIRPVKRYGIAGDDLSNAEFIVHACNSHYKQKATIDELLEACKAMERISALWLPTETSEEHKDEAIALHHARGKILNAISKAGAA